MNIEIQRPELEVLIHQRMQNGGFRSVEDVLMHALTIASVLESGDEPTGAGPVTAMQTCPLKEINLEPERYPLPVRDVILCGRGYSTRTSSPSCGAPDPNQRLWLLFRVLLSSSFTSVR